MALENLPLFTSLTKQGKEMLTQGVICKTVEPATQLLHKGQAVSGAYIVVSGRLRVYSIAPSGTEATLYTIDRGETCVLALNCLFNDCLYPAWVQSEAATEVAVIPGGLYRRLFSKEPPIQELTVHALSTVVFRLMGELEQVHFYKLEHRLANLILLRAAADGILRMTQQEIAHHLGTTREVVARLLREFVARDFIETSRGYITILNSAGLSDLIAFNLDAQ